MSQLAWWKSVTKIARLSALLSVLLLSSPACIDWTGYEPGGSNNGNGNGNGNTNGNDSGGGTSGGSDNGGSGADDGAAPDSGGDTDGGDIDGGLGDAGGAPDSGNGAGGDPDTGADPNSGADPNTGGGTGSGGGGSGGPPTTIEYSLIAESGDAVPEQPQGVTFTAFGNPVIDSAGRVAFWATYAGTGAAGFGGLYYWDGAIVRKVVDDNPASAGVVPGRSTQDYFGRFQSTSSFDPLTQEVIWAGGDRLLFNSPVSGQTSSRGFYRWRATDGNMARIADLEQIIALYPDASPGAFIPDFGVPGVSDAGLGVFGVKYRYFTTPPGATLIDAEVICTSNGTAISVVRDSEISQNTGGDVPGQGVDVAFTFLTQQTTVNAAGDLLIEGRYGGGQGNRGLYLLRGGELFLVIDNRNNTSWPGLSGVTRVNPTNVALRFANGPGGHIALDCPITAGGANREAVIVYDFNTSTWAEYTGEGGAAAAALLSGVSDDGRVLLLSNGSPFVAGPTGSTRIDAAPPAALVGAGVTWSSTTGSINNNERAAALYTRGSADGLAFWSGERLLVVADPVVPTPTGTTGVFTITDPRRDRVGRSGMLNDRDEMTFRVTRASGQAIYLAAAR